MDITGRMRPLDGDADSTTAFDIGAYEVMHASADSDDDGMPDYWEQQFFGHPTNELATIDRDSDSAINLAEYVADTDPTNLLSVLRVLGDSVASGPLWQF